MSNAFSTYRQTCTYSYAVTYHKAYHARASEIIEWYKSIAYQKSIAALELLKWGVCGGVCNIFLVNYWKAFLLISIITKMIVTNIGRLWNNKL